MGIERIVELGRLVVDYCLGKLGEDEFIKKAEELGWNRRELSNFIDHTFRELDKKKWS